MADLDGGTATPTTGSFADAAQTAAALALKADASTVTTALAGKASTSAVALKADQSDLISVADGLDTKVDSTDIRMTNARTPTPHDHTAPDLGGVVKTINGLAPEEDGSIVISAGAAAVVTRLANTADVNLPGGTFAFVQTKAMVNAGAGAITLGVNTIVALASPGNGSDPVDPLNYSNTVSGDNSPHTFDLYLIQDATGGRTVTFQPPIVGATVTVGTNPHDVTLLRMAYLKGGLGWVVLSSTAAQPQLISISTVDGATPVLGYYLRGTDTAVVQGHINFLKMMTTWQRSAINALTNRIYIDNQDVVSPNWVPNFSTQTTLSYAGLTGAGGVLQDEALTWVGIFRSDTVRAAGSTIAWAAGYGTVVPTTVNQANWAQTLVNAGAVGTTPWATTNLFAIHEQCHVLDLFHGAGGIARATATSGSAPVKTGGGLATTLSDITDFDVIYTSLAAAATGSSYARTLKVEYFAEALAAYIYQLSTGDAGPLNLVFGTGGIGPTLKTAFIAAVVKYGLA